MTEFSNPTLTLASPDADWVAYILMQQDGTDLMGVGLQQLLIGSTQERDPARFANIFRQAQAQAGGRPWLALACMLMEVSGSRRQGGVTMEQMQELNQRLTQADALVGELDKHPHLSLLAGRFRREEGLVLRMLRSYREAKDAQRAAAFHFAEAGEKTMTLECLFLSLVEHASECLVDNWGVELALYAMVNCRAGALQQHPSDSYPLWMRDNAALHIWHAHLMAELHGFVSLGYDGDALRADEEAIADRYKPDANHWGALFHVVQAFKAHNWDEVHTRVATAAEKFGAYPSSSTANAATTWMLLDALAHQKQGDYSKAKELLRSVKSYPGVDGGVAVALAGCVLSGCAKP